MKFERVRIGDVLALDRVPVQPRAEREYVSIGVRSFGKGIFHYEPVTGDRLGKLRFFEVQPDRLVISNIKGWEGAVAVSQSAESGCLASNRFLQLVPRREDIDVRWAMWFFLSEGGNDLLQRASPGSADRNRTLAIERFEALEIPLPPIDEQRRVAARLDFARERGSAMAALGADADTLLGALHVSTASRHDLPDSARLARGWRRAALGTVMTPAPDVVSVASTSSYPNVGVLSFGRGLFEKPPIDGMTTSAKTLNRIRSGQFIYSRLFAFEGSYAYVPERFDGWFVSGEFPTFDPDPDHLDARWLSNYLRSPDRWSELGVSSKGLGQRRQRVPAEAVLAHEVWLPPIEQQHDMVKVIERADAIAERRRRAVTLSSALTPSLLNQAFAGLL